jgi:hypothetical protein
MPRYYFHIRDDFESMDDEGMEFPTLRAAIDHAVAGVRSLAAETVAEGHLVCHHRVDIADDAGTILVAVRFDEAIIIRP